MGNSIFCLLFTILNWERISKILYCYPSHSIDDMPKNSKWAIYDENEMDMILISIKKWMRI
jgi:hypothetical protein